MQKRYGGQLQMNRNVSLLLIPILMISLIPSSFAQSTSFDLEDVNLAVETNFVTEDDRIRCGITELKNNIFLPFTMTVQFPQTLDAQVQMTSRNPEESEMKKIQDKDFFTISSRNSTDAFTVKAVWTYESKPNEPRTISYEIFSSDIQIETGNWKFNDFSDCHIWTIETKVKEHIPTLEEFQKENDIAINKAFEIVSNLMLDNNDLIFILILIIVGLGIIVSVLVGVLIWSQRDISLRAEESENRLNQATLDVNNLISGLKILARSDSSMNEKMRDSFLRVISVGSTNISNLIIDLRKILQMMLNNNPSVIEPVHLKSDAVRPIEEIKKVKEVIDVKKKEEHDKNKPLSKLTSFISNKDKPKKIENTSEEFYFEKYNDPVKYPMIKLETIDSHLRKQYEKEPTVKMVNEINAIAKVVKLRLSIK